MTLLLLICALVGVMGLNLLRGGIWLWLSFPCYAVLAVAAFITVLRARKVSLAINWKQPWVVGAGGFIGYMVIRTLYSPVEYQTRNDLFSLLGASIFYLLIALHLLKPNSRGAFVAVLLAVATANCVVGAIQFSQGTNFMPIPGLTRENYGNRASGFLGCPNHLAGFLEIALFLGLAMTFWSRWRMWAKVLLGYGSIICVVGILLTGSRGGYVSTVAGLLVFLVLSFWILARQRFDRLGYVLGGVGVVVITAALGFMVLVERSDSLRVRLLTATTTDSVRMSIWPSAVQQFKLSPAFGTGAGTFLYYGRQFRDPTVQTDPQFTHNDYLQLLGEFGVVGLLTFLLMLGTHVGSGWKALGNFIAPRNPFEGFGNTGMALTVGALSALAAIAVHSVVDFNLHIPANAVIVAFLFGVLATPGEVESKNSAQPSKLDLIMPFILPALGVWVLAAGWAKFFGDYQAHLARRSLGDWTTLETGEYARRAAAEALQGLQSDPGNIDLLNYLGESLAAQAELAKDPIERARLLTESIDAGQRALHLAPMDRDVLLGLAWSLDPARRFAESEPLFRRAVELDPNSGYVRWALAAHLQLVGSLDEAEAEYKKAAALGNAAANHALVRLEESRKAGALQEASAKSKQ